MRFKIIAGYARDCTSFPTEEINPRDDTLARKNRGPTGRLINNKTQFKRHDRENSGVSADDRADRDVPQPCNARVLGTFNAGMNNEILYHGLINACTALPDKSTNL